MNSRNDVDVSLLLIEVHNTIQNKRMNEALKKKNVVHEYPLGVLFVLLFIAINLHVYAKKNKNWQTNHLNPLINITNFDLSFDDSDLWNSAAVPLWNALFIWSWSAYWPIAIGEERRPKYECHHNKRHHVIGWRRRLSHEKQKKTFANKFQHFFPFKGINSQENNLLLFATVCFAHQVGKILHFWILVTAGYRWLSLEQFQFVDSKWIATHHLRAYITLTERQVVDW